MNEEYSIAEQLKPKPAKILAFRNRASEREAALRAFVGDLIRNHGFSRYKLAPTFGMRRPALDRWLEGTVPLSSTELAAVEAWHARCAQMLEEMTSNIRR